MKILKLIFLSFSFLLFIACDKEGNPLPSSNKLEVQKDGVMYVDERSIILPPGAKDGPHFSYTPAPNHEYETYLEHILFTSSPYKKGNRNAKEFSIIIYLPVNGGAEINKKYEIKPINGIEKYQEGKDSKFDKYESGLSFIEYIENYQTKYYGTGYIQFTKFDTTNGNDMVKGIGEFEFTVPNENGGRSTIKGNFKLL